MTFEAYLDGALWFRQVNWIPRAENQRTSDGRLINGDWCEIFARSDAYVSNGNRWQCYYSLSVNVPPRARLDYSIVETEYIENPDGIVDTPYEYHYQAEGIGPRNNVPVRIFGWNRCDDDDYFSVGTRFRLVVRLYFSRVSQLILRDPEQGNAILRSSAEFGNIIQRDA